jgi:hypothetical protein
MKELPHEISNTWTCVRVWLRKKYENDVAYKSTL